MIGLEWTVISQIMSSNFLCTSLKKNRTRILSRLLMSHRTNVIDAIFHSDLAVTNNPVCSFAESASRRW
jgi:hypothetical protein